MLAATCVKAAAAAHAAGAGSARALFRRGAPPTAAAAAVVVVPAWPWRAQHRGRCSSAGLGHGKGSRADRRKLRCSGFVGEGTRIAGEYHDADFEWEEVQEEGRTAVARQLREWAEWQRSGQEVPTGQPSGGSAHQGGGHSHRGTQASSSTGSGDPARNSSSTGSSDPTGSSSGSSTVADSSGSLEVGLEAVAGSEGEGASWERFHATHSQARFFKEKR